MAYTIETFEDLLRVLRERAEWREQLRALILTEELLALPEKFERFRQEEFLPLKEKIDSMGRDEGVLKEDVAMLKRDIGDLKGDNFERKVKEKVNAYFGKFIKKPKVLSTNEWGSILDDALNSRIIIKEERKDALNSDLILTGLLRDYSEKNVVAVSEISMKVDKKDVERASHRAKVFEKAMYHLLPLLWISSLPK